MRRAPKCGHTIFHEECKDCQSLQKECYKILAESDFEDIEDTDKSSRLLKAWHSFRFPSIHLSKRQGLEDYYRLAGALLHTFQFEKPIHRFIWELHCEGKSKREIETALQESEHEPKYKRETILNIIQKIAQEIKR